MKSRVTKNQIEEVIQELVDYHKELDEIYGDEQKLKNLKTYKEFLIDKKTEELVEKLIKENKVYEVEYIVTEASNDETISQNELLLEYEQYKKIPKTNLTYRFDKGTGKPGFDDHIHVYLGQTKSQVYAINKSGTPHDGSKAKLGKKEIRFLKSIGFTPPTNGIVEWITLDDNKDYIYYDYQLLYS